MNFLAHLYLSGNDTKVMVGNFIGDFVKGKNLAERFETDIVFGIELHRSIDEFTDKHPIVKQSKRRLSAGYRHYSGVIVDVFYDHFLASHWSEFSPEPLVDYARKAYDTIQSEDRILPDELKVMLPYMINGNWLLSYAKVEGVHRALSGMARRTPFQSNMEKASTDLVESYDAFNQEFMSFFPELQKHSRQFLADRRRP